MFNFCSESEPESLYVYVPISSCKHTLSTLLYIHLYIYIYKFVYTLLSIYIFTQVVYGNYGVFKWQHVSSIPHHMVFLILLINFYTDVHNPGYRLVDREIEKERESMSVCVCVCICVRETERQRQRMRSVLSTH